MGGDGLDGVVRAVALGPGGNVAFGFEPAPETFELGEPDREIDRRLSEVNLERPNGQGSAGGITKQPAGFGDDFASQGEIRPGAEMNFSRLQLGGAELHKGKGLAKFFERKGGRVMEGAEEAGNGETGGDATAVKAGRPEESGEAGVEDGEVGSGDVVELFPIESGQEFTIVRAAAGSVLFEGGERGLEQLRGGLLGLVAGRDGLREILGNGRVQPGRWAEDEDLEEPLAIEDQMSCDFRRWLGGASHKTGGGLLPGGSRQGGPG